MQRHRLIDTLENVLRRREFGPLVGLLTLIAIFGTMSDHLWSRQEVNGYLAERLGRDRRGGRHLPDDLRRVRSLGRRGLAISAVMFEVIDIRLQPLARSRPYQARGLRRARERDRDDEVRDRFAIATLATLLVVKASTS